MPDRLIKINSYQELLRQEPTIIDRINKLPNGGSLFLAHPFLLFKDINVEISATAEREILAAEPRLAGLSETPYKALKNSRTPQNYRIRLRGLFNRRGI